MEKKHCEKFDYSFIKNDYVCLYTLHLQKTLFSAYLKLVHSFHLVYFNNFNMPFKSVPHWIT